MQTNEERKAEAEKAYYDHFGAEVPIYAELSEDQILEKWYIEAIEDAIDLDEIELDIRGHYKQNVDY